MSWVVILLENVNEEPVIRGVYTKRRTAIDRVLKHERRLEHEWERGSFTSHLRKPSKLASILEQDCRGLQRKLIGGELCIVTELILQDLDKGGPWTTPIGWYLLEVKSG
jgi:hypothetical protein